jgi:hypothetical protein
MKKEGCVMPESIHITISIFAIFIVYILTMLGKGWRTRCACLQIIQELEEKGAVHAEAAMTLPYGQVNYFHIGHRDYRTRTQESLMGSEIVYRTFNGQYY